MSSKTEPQGPQSELEDAIASGMLSGPLLAQAQDIFDRLDRPVRLGVMGLPGSGKSMLLNLLLGADVIPLDESLPSMQLSYGDKPEAICTLVDRTTQTVPGDDLSAIVDLSPIFVDVKLPLPALKKLSMLEIVAGAQPAEQHRAIQWASKRIDIALWCCEGEFDAAQQDIWSAAPEKTQDHAFLMLTKTDTLQALANHDRRVADATSMGQDYFKSVLPIGSQTAVSARKSDGTIDKAALRSSGGIALISSILRDVEAGRQQVLDQAHMFLHQIDFTRVPKEKTPKPPITSQAVQPIKAEVPEVVEAPEVIVEKTVEPVAAEISTTLAPTSLDAVEQAVAQLEAEGQVMAEAQAAGTLEIATVVETCVDTVSWLAEYLSESGPRDDRVMARNRDAAADAADLIQLIQLESGDNVATDAMCLMLQLKREMQMSLAA